MLKEIIFQLIGVFGFFLINTGLVLEFFYKKNKVLPIKILCVGTFSMAISTLGMVIVFWHWFSSNTKTILLGTTVFFITAYYYFLQIKKKRISKTKTQ